MKVSIGAKTVLHPHPVLIVGSFDAGGKPNLAAVAWGGICCSKPPAVGVSLREATKTFHNIKHAGAFTVNIPSEAHVRAADFCGVASGKDTDKFEKAGLTPVKSEVVNAPYVGEFPFILECRLLRAVEIGLHTQFIGEIMDVKADEEVLGENGLPDIEKVRPLVYATGNKQYFGVSGPLGKAFTTKDP